MKKGKTYSDIAVYLPTEDAWSKGVMPKNLQFKWAWGYYEMRYVYFPKELSGFNPSWINYEFLEKAKVRDGNLLVGSNEFNFLYLDAKYLDYKLINKLNELAEQGLKIIMKQLPGNPSAVSFQDYQDKVVELMKNKNVLRNLPHNIKPFLTGDEIPKHWCRIDDNTLYIFLPNPKADQLKFPMEYGQSLCDETIIKDINISYKNEIYNVTLEFKPYQSLMYKIEDGKITQLNIEFIPKTPTVKKRPDGYEAPWLVK